MGEPSSAEIDDATVFFKHFAKVLDDRRRQRPPTARPVPRNRPMAWELNENPGATPGPGFARLRNPLRFCRRAGFASRPVSIFQVPAACGHWNL